MRVISVRFDIKVSLSSCYRLPNFHHGCFGGDVGTADVVVIGGVPRDCAQIEFQTMASNGITLDQSI